MLGIRFSRPGLKVTGRNVSRPPEAREAPALGATQGRRQPGHTRRGHPSPSASDPVTGLQPFALLEIEVRTLISGIQSPNLWPGLGPPCDRPCADCPDLWGSLLGPVPTDKSAPSASPSTKAVPP